MSKYWIKLYHEILDDPKMGRLSEHLWKRTIELFLLAGIENDGGGLPNTEDMAWRLRTSVDELQIDLENLQACNIVTCIDGEWTVTKFSERQRPSTDAERVEYYRERKRKEELIVTNSNNSVTGSLQKAVQDIDIDTDIDTDKDSAKKSQKTPEDEQREKSLAALQRGMSKDAAIRSDVLVHLGINPNWDTKANKDWLEWAMGRSPTETIQKFGIWWYENDWRGKNKQAPTLAQVRELWPQAFKGTPPKEFNSARRKQHEAAAEIQRQRSELKKGTND